MYLQLEKNIASSLVAYNIGYIVKNYKEVFILIMYTTNSRCYLVGRYVGGWRWFDALETDLGEFVAYLIFRHYLKFHY